MIKKILIFISITLLIGACDYKPLYSINENSNFNIVILEINGDKNINNFLKNGLNIYKDKKSKKNYEVSLTTSYSKSILAKDKTANTTDYKLSVFVEMSLIDLSNDSIEKKISFNEDLNIKKDTNNFNQANYENISKINLAEVILEKIILFLNNQK